MSVGGGYPIGPRRNNFAVLFLIILLLLCFPFFCGGLGIY